MSNHRAMGTGRNEWYTPEKYLEVARAFLGGFDLDPASSALAQQTVRAGRYFTAEQDGLAQKWAGRVWLNPPYAQPLIARFIEKAVAEFSEGNVVEAVILTHNYTDTAWFHLAASAASAICFTRGRVGFLDADGKRASPTQGQAFFYLGKRASEFAEAFSGIGLVASPTLPTGVRAELAEARHEAHKLRDRLLQYEGAGVAMSLGFRYYRFPWER